MACPICDHTMQNVKNVSWCPRCGTIRYDQTTINPSLVDKCRGFEYSLGYYYRSFWNKLGIHESIYPPHERD